MSSKKRRTIVCSISFQLEVWDWLKSKPNISKIVNIALKEYQERRKKPEEKINLLKDKKRDIIKQLNRIDEEIDNIFAVEIGKNPEEMSSLQEQETEKDY